VTKLSPAGNALVYSTYLGGSNDEQGTYVAVDAVGGAYVAGFTQSADFPTVSAFQTALKSGPYYGSDAFAAKLQLPATIASNPPGLALVVDGVSAAAPQAYDWAAGTVHTIHAPTPQTFGGTVYIFTGWSDGGGQAHSITAPSAVAVYLATFTAVAPGAPQAVSVDPPAGNWSYAAYTFTFSDSAGWQNISVANVLINNFVDGRNACYVAIVPGQSAVYLVDDAGDAGGPYQGITLPGPGTAQNSQCSIGAAGSSISGSGNTLIVTLAITFKSAFAGNKVIYLAAQDAGGANSGWQALGTCGVPGNTPIGPAVGGVTPARSSGTGGGTFVFMFTDTNGWQDLGVMNILINNALDGRQACYLAYSRQYNVLYLVNDAGNGLLPGLTLSGSGTLGNSQCTVTGAGSSASGSGNTLTLTLNMTFPSSFAGNRIVYAAARSNGDVLNSGWQSVGSLTVQ
jgi:hypothetical protein